MKWVGSTLSYIHLLGLGDKRLRAIRSGCTVTPLVPSFDLVIEYYMRSSDRIARCEFQLRTPTTICSSTNVCNVFGVSLMVCMCVCVRLMELRINRELDRWGEWIKLDRPPKRKRHGRRVFRVCLCDRLGFVRLRSLNGRRSCGDRIEFDMHWIWKL